MASAPLSGASLVRLPVASSRMDAPAPSAPDPRALIVADFELSLARCSLDRLERAAAMVDRAWLEAQFERFGETEEATLLATCCRREVAVVVRSAEAVARWEAALPLPAGSWRRYEGREATQHLVRVAAGRESVVVGENEVRAQVRGAARRHPAVTFETRAIVTSGDRDLRPGSSPDFTDAIDRALLRREVDLCVHSAKDLPADLPSGLAIAACPPRADARDCLVCLPGPTRAAELPRGARVGSSSLRRRAQLLRWRPDLDVAEIRGNVDRRLERVRGGELDGVVVALAGLRRLGRAGEATRVLSFREFLPAPAQGALAVVVRSDGTEAREVAAGVDHAPTRAAVEAERAFSRRIGGDCRTPLAAHARVAGRRLRLTGELLSPDGRTRLRASRAGVARDATAVGRELAEILLGRGGSDLLRRAGR